MHRLGACARQPFEFGVKVSRAVTHKSGLVVGARSFPGYPYDGHTLAGQIEQTITLLQDIGVKPTKALVDLGYRGVDHLVPINIIHRGRCRTMTDLTQTAPAQLRGWPHGCAGRCRSGTGCRSSRRRYRRW